MAQTYLVETSGGLCILLLSHDELCSYFSFFALFKVLQKINFQATTPHITNTEFVFQTQLEG